jgi:hypothetical protein
VERPAQGGAAQDQALPMRRLGQQVGFAGQHPRPTRHLGGHAAGDPALVAGRDDHAHIRAVAQARAALAKQVHEGVVLAAGEGRQAADRAIERYRKGEARAGMVAVARGRIVRRRVEDVLQAPHADPVTLDPRVQVGKARIGGAVIVDHEAAADHVGRLQRPQVRRDPVGRQAGIGVGGQQDSVRTGLGVEPVGARIERHPPGGTDMGLRALQRCLDHPQRQARERARFPQGADGRHRAVSAVVGENHDPQRRLSGKTLLPGQGREQDRQPLFLVPRGDADDAGPGDRGGGCEGHSGSSQPHRRESSRRSVCLLIAAERAPRVSGAHAFEGRGAGPFRACSHVHTSVHVRRDALYLLLAGRGKALYF